MLRSRVLVPIAGLAATALLLSACGSSSGGGSSSSPSGTSSSSSDRAASTPSSSAPASSGSAAGSPTKAQLQKIVLQQSDLPAGFEGKPTTPDSEDNALSTQLATCTGVKGAPQSHKVATAESDDFTKSQVTVSSSFDSFQSQSDVDTDVAQLKSPKVNSCLNTIFKAELTKSLAGKGTIDNAEIKLTPGSGGGPSNVVALAAGVVNVTASGQKAVINLGVAFITGPKLGGTLSYVGIGERLDTATQAKVLAAVAQRAQNP